MCARSVAHVLGDEPSSCVKMDLLVLWLLTLFGLEELVVAWTVCR